MVSMVLGVVLWLAQASVPTRDNLVIVIDRTPTGITYECNGRRVDERGMLAAVMRELGPRPSPDRPTFVFVDEELSTRIALEMSALLGNTVGLRDIRFFGFSRRTQVMGEMKFMPERWKLSFDGTLTKSNR